MNGPRNGPNNTRQGDDPNQASKRQHNYKLIVDPALHKGQQKLYRIDGVIPGDPISKVIVTDPRSRVARFLTKSKQADLIIPQFKVDEFYVGIPPPREVTFVNLNDNINSDFLRKMVQDMGRIDECSVCYNPQNGKHLGIAKVVFETTRAAKICVEKFNQATKMGNLMTVFTDPLGKERQGYIDEKVYGIPRRQVDYRSDFNPKPEVYVEPSERSHTPHIPTGQTPHISTQTSYLSHDPNLPNETGEYPEENYQDNNSGYLEHPQYPQQEVLENHNHGHPPTNNRLREPEQMPYENGYREEEERLNMDNRRRDRDHFTNRDEGKMRDLYSERDRGKLNRYDSRDGRRGNYHNRRERDNRDYDRDRDRYRDRDRDRDRGERRYDRRDEWDKARDSQDNRSRDRDSRYGRGQTISRHGRDSEHHREPPNSRPNQTETEIDRHLELNILRDIDKLRSRLEEQPPASLESTDSHIHPQPQEQHAGESKTLTADASPAAEDTSPAADPGGLDLDSRIMMMLNQNKDLAGFGAPEPVAPSDSVPAPMIPLDPQTGLPPPVMPHQAHYPPGAPTEGQYSNGYPPPAHLPVPPPGFLPGPPPQPPPIPSVPAGAPVNHVNHVNMPPPAPPGWQPQADGQTPGQYGYPPPEEGMYAHPHEGFEYMDQQGYEGYDQEPEQDQLDYADAFDISLEDLIGDLKNIMNKDICKKMVTQSAYKFFESWWSSEQDKSKSFKISDDSQSNDASRLSEKSTAPSTSADSNLPTAGSSSAAASSSAPVTLTSFSSLFDGSSIFGSSAASGSVLGMRAGLPKMPSFRRKISPTRELEIQKEKEEKERQKAEDEERRERKRGGRVIKRRGGSVSSGQESSSGSESGSDSDSDSSGSQSSDSDDGEEAKTKKISSSGSESGSSSSSEESESESETESSSAAESDDEKGGKKPPAKKKAPVKKSAPSKSKSIVESPTASSGSESESEDEEKARARDTTPVPSGDEAMDTGDEFGATTDQTLGAEEPSSDKEGAEDLNKSPVKSPAKSPPKGKRGRKQKMSERMDTITELDDAAFESDDVTTPAADLPDTKATSPSKESAAKDKPTAGDEKEGEDVDIDLMEEKEDEPKPDLYVMIEHAYCRPPAEAPAPAKKEKKRGRPPKELQDITSKVSAKGNRELDRLLKDIPTVADKTKAKPATPVSKFVTRDNVGERTVLFDIFNHGVDVEDLQYFRMCYEKMLAKDDVQYDWCNDTHWVDHSVTSIPDPAGAPPTKKSRRSSQTDSTCAHKTGSARTEGFYKISAYEKSKYMTNARQFETVAKATVPGSNSDAKVAAQNMLREARSNQRRLATAFGDLDTGELLKFNQLKFRKKALRFSRSYIHDWGLYACEPIVADTMVIEYVGAILRHAIADEREKHYERVGIGSSYLFRIDGETVIDATKCGNLARFVNHSCDPNCYARVITVDGAKKIVIYSRRKIEMDEEITYDYKFPYEDEKIPCLCGAATCRGFLN